MLRRGLPVEYSYFLISFFFKKCGSPAPTPLPPPLHRPSICTGPGGPWTNATTYVFIVNWWLIFAIYGIYFFGKKVLHFNMFQIPKSASQLQGGKRRLDLAVASYWKQQKLMKLIRVVYSEKIDNQKYIILINHRHVNLVNRKLTAELTPESLRRFYRKKAFF